MQKSQKGNKNLSVFANQREIHGLQFSVWAAEGGRR